MEDTASEIFVSFMQERTLLVFNEREHNKHKNAMNDSYICKFKKLQIFPSNKFRKHFPFNCKNKTSMRIA